MRKIYGLLLVFVFLVSVLLTMARPVSATFVFGDNSWTEMAPMHVARSDLGVAVVDGKIYAIGGSTMQISQSLPVSGGIVGTNEEYDPTTNTWSMKAPMPTPVGYFFIAVYENKIYCIGGASFFSDHEEAQLSNATQVYDPRTDTWSSKSPMPIAKSTLLYPLYDQASNGVSGQANVASDKIFLIGGAPNGWLNEVYDPANDSWTIKASVPTSLGLNYASTVINNKIYAIGNSIEIYDPTNDIWASGLPIPSVFATQSNSNILTINPVAGATLGVNAPERIYIFSGFAARPGYFKSTQIYNADNNTWVTGAVMPTGRTGFGLAILKDSLYVIGGSIETWPSSISDTLITIAPTVVNEEYTPVGYGTVAPVVSVVSPTNGTDASSEVSLNFSANQPVGWVGYSLDGKSNITVTGNTTLSGLSNGLHNITVYANDTFGNVGTSETVSFTVAKQEPFPTVTVATAASLVAVVIVGVALGVYFKMRRRRL